MEIATVASARSPAIPSASSRRSSSIHPDSRITRPWSGRRRVLKPGQQAKGQIKAAHDQRVPASRAAGRRGMAKSDTTHSAPSPAAAFTRASSEAISASLKQSRKKWLTMRSNGASGNAASSHASASAVHQPDLRLRWQPLRSRRSILLLASDAATRISGTRRTSSARNRPSPSPYTSARRQEAISAMRKHPALLQIGSKAKVFHPVIDARQTIEAGRRLIARTASATSRSSGVSRARSAAMRRPPAVSRERSSTRKIQRSEWQRRPASAPAD